MVRAVNADVAVALAVTDDVVQRQLVMIIGGNTAYVALAASGAQGTVLAPVSNGYIIVPIIVGVALGDHISTLTAIGIAVVLFGVLSMSMQKKQVPEEEEAGSGAETRRSSFMGM